MKICADVDLGKSFQDTKNSVRLVVCVCGRNRSEANDDRVIRSGRKADILPEVGRLLTAELRRKGAKDGSYSVILSSGKKMPV